MRLRSCGFLLRNGLPILALLAADCLAACAQNWTNLPVSMNTPRYRHAAALGPDSRIYALGGQDAPASDGLQSVEAFDPTSQTWTTVHAMNEPRYLFAAVTAPSGNLFENEDGKSLLYAIGGCSRGNPVASMEAYNPSTDTWSYRAAMPAGRERHAAVRGPDDMIYVFGGLSGNRDGILPTTWRYDPSTDTWDTLIVMNATHVELAGALVKAADGSMRPIAFSGFDGDGMPQPDTESFDIVKDVWNIRAPIGQGRGGLAASVAPDGTVYVFGGYAGSTVYKRTDHYSPSNNTWSSGPDLNSARRSLAGASGPNGEIYAIGGMVNGTIVRSAEVLTF